MFINDDWVTFDTAEIESLPKKTEDLCTAYVSDHDPRWACRSQCSCKAKFKINGVLVCKRHLNQIKKYGKNTIVTGKKKSGNLRGWDYTTNVYAWKDLLEAEKKARHAKYAEENRLHRENEYRSSLYTICAEHGISQEVLLKLLPSRKDHVQDTDS